MKAEMRRLWDSWDVWDGLSRCRDIYMFTESYIPMRKDYYSLLYI